MQNLAGQVPSLPFNSSFHYQTPRDVIADQRLDTLQKRAILSSWASDLFAVESCPWLRKVPGVIDTLRLGDILEALRTLDDEDDPPPRGGAALRISPSRRNGQIRIRPCRA
jgi:hypothetical protein